MKNRKTLTVLGCVDAIVSSGSGGCPACHVDDLNGFWCVLEVRERNVPTDGTYPTWCPLVVSSITLELKR